MKHKIYLASSWRNRYQPGLVQLLRSAPGGHEVYDFRNPAPDHSGFSWSEIDPEWEAWDCPKYRAGLSNPIAEKGFQMDMYALENADIVVLLLPSGRSAHVEAAYHKGKGGVVIVHSPEPCEPELMYKMFNAITETDEELLALLELGLDQLKNYTLAGPLPIRLRRTSDGVLRGSANAGLR